MTGSRYGSLIISLLLSVLTLVSSAAWRAGEMKVRIDTVKPQFIQDISRSGIEIDYIEANSVYLYVIPAELERIQNLGHSPEIIIRDMQAYSREQIASGILDGYHGYERTRHLVDSLIEAYPDIIQLSVYGTSVDGRELFAVKISDNVELDEAEPEVGFDGCHHGDEPVTGEILVRLMRDLCDSYGRDPQITRLVNTREIHIYPFINPDGREDLTRRNSNYVDINRDWGFMWDGWGNSREPLSQPETRAAFDWLTSRSFAALQSMHAGAALISWPWSYQPNQSADHQTFEWLSAPFVEAVDGAPINAGQGYSSLYPISGSAKDSYYGANGVLGWTFELAKEKVPQIEEVARIYDSCRSALLIFIEKSGAGIHGRVLDAESGEAVSAIVRIESPTNQYWPVYAGGLSGDFHKTIEPGEYRAVISANGYETLVMNRLTVSDTGALNVQVALTPRRGTGGYRVIASCVPARTRYDAGLTYRTLGAPDGLFYSLGKRGWIIIDLGSTVADMPGNDLRIIEAGNEGEGYRLSVAEDISGPWRPVGEGVGTMEFDIAGSSAPAFRFVRIEDDGDGFSGMVNAGFDLDAVEASLIPLDRPYLLAIDYTIIDTLSNFNAILEAGESVQLDLEIANLGGATSNQLTILLKSLNPSLLVTQDSLMIDAVPGGKSRKVSGFALKSKLAARRIDAALTVTIKDDQSGATWEHLLTVPLFQGPSIVMDTAEVSFGNVYVNRAVTHQLRIQNSGADTLKVFQLQLADGPFRTESTQLKILPGQEHLVDVQFEPVREQLHRDTLYLLTNDPRHAVRWIAFSGVGKFAPALKTDFDSLSLSLLPTDSVALGFLLENEGAGELSYSFHLTGASSVQKRVEELVSDGVAYVWKREGAGISSSSPLATEQGTVVPFAPGESISDPLVLPFRFAFYDDIYTDCRVGLDGRIWWGTGEKNGILSAQYGGSQAYSFLAPFWYDFVSGPESSIRYESQEGKFIIEWRNLLTVDGEGPYTFSVTLQANGEFNFNYHQLAHAQLASWTGLHHAELSTTLASSEIELAEVGSIAIRRSIDLRLSHNSGVIQPGSRQAVTLSVLLDDFPVAAFEAELVLISNDPEIPEHRIPLHGLISDKMLFSGDGELVPEEITLFQNFPNPFNPRTTIVFHLPQQLDVRLTLFNTLGQEIRMLVDENLPAGEYRINWEGENHYGHQLPSGIYFYELRAGDWSQIKKMVLLR